MNLKIFMGNCIVYTLYAVSRRVRSKTAPTGEVGADMRVIRAAV